ncbi:MAG: hypothetical protein HXY34_10515 [Candidatus Thorarchaeota archaeon]|nr:hypothetical protein [Candidatus Thorarchaeota archaeon]
MTEQSQRMLYGVLLLVVIVAAGALATLTLMTDTAQPTVNLTGHDMSTRKVTLTQMKGMPTVHMNGSFQNSFGNIRGAGEYRGVRVSALVELAGGMEANDTVQVISSDGYNRTFGYRNVYPNSTEYGIQGHMVLAFEYNGSEVPDYEDGFRLMFLTDDGVFSNADAAQVYPDLGTGSAGSLCVSKVATIRVLPHVTPQPAALTVHSVSHTREYSIDELMALPAVTGQAGYVKTGVSPPTVVPAKQYKGVGLYGLLISIEALPSSYSVEITSRDGYKTYLNKTQLEGTLQAYNTTDGSYIGTESFTLILAYEEDGVPLSTGGPIRLVLIPGGEYFGEGRYWARDVVSVTVLDETLCRSDL